MLPLHRACLVCVHCTVLVGSKRGYGLKATSSELDQTTAELTPSQELTMWLTCRGLHHWSVQF